MSNFVVDTNLIISATLGKGSPVFLGIEKLIVDGHNLIFSLETFHEVEEVIKRTKFDRYVPREKREEFLTVCVAVCVFVLPQKHFTYCRDEKDNKFLDVAVAG